ncbi:hypothetical protein KW803_02495 [Candidatus Saccharibacteria bacterium]|nr:hypothetical protein [Candidatus Saccharibacteria bacterium]
MLYYIGVINPENADNLAAPETEDNAVSIGEKELKSMLAEMRNADLVVLEIIDEALREPIPDLDDQAAVDEFNHKMVMLKDLASQYLARSVQLVQIEAQIDQRLHDLRS